jgi:hypothetical protein
MKTAQQLTNELIYRMKNTEMNWYEIKREVVDNWLPQGIVPWDIHVKNGVATLKVYASSLQDAEDQVSMWLEKDDNEQD